MTSSNANTQQTINFNLHDYLQEVQEHVQNAGVITPTGATWAVDIQYGLVRFSLTDPAGHQGLIVTMDGVKVGTHKETVIAAQVGAEFVKVLHAGLPSPIQTTQLP
ncbi:hypothetical protein GCM10017784_32180 [Deinococcus indicus]|uniref:hypothetical protein n=1 Tax=Deinococcus indicus TaxID=223556 RepID=UPI00174AB2E0|nr:hypothetical protein [Deinococcus indicus]GHG35712.1 hypothetical protein GCM10017784_32180 [Deinococcus indicus]